MRNECNCSEMQSIGEHVFSTKEKLGFKVGKLEKGNSRKRQNTQGCKRKPLHDALLILQFKFAFSLVHLIRCILDIQGIWMMRLMVQISFKIFSLVVDSSM